MVARLSSSDWNVSPCSAGNGFTVTCRRLYASCVRAMFRWIYGASSCSSLGLTKKRWNIPGSSSPNRNELPNISATAAMTSR